MTWHSAYRERVLEPDYTFAERHLAPHLLDALSAHVKTVARLPMSRPHQAEVEALLAALRQLYAEPPIPYDPGVPDLYFAVNRRLEATLGEPTVSFLRLGLSRNDLDMTVYKLRARDLLLSLGQQLCDLRGAILKQAETHLETVLIAYTHHQPGQPTTVAHYLAAIEGALARDSERLLAAFERLNTCPLGAAALAGSSHPLDRAYTAQLLGFLAPVENTYDAVAASDWQLDIVGVSQSCAVTSSRFVCDLLNWASQGVFRLGDGLGAGLLGYAAKTQSGRFRARPHTLFARSGRVADGALFVTQYPLRRPERFRPRHSRCTSDSCFYSSAAAWPCCTRA